MSTMLLALFLLQYQLLVLNPHYIKTLMAYLLYGPKIKLWKKDKINKIIFINIFYIIYTLIWSTISWAKIGFNEESDSSSWYCFNMEKLTTLSVGIQWNTSS